VKFSDIGPCILVFDPTGDYSWLSNFADSRIEALGAVWATAEHLYQAQKFVSPVHRERIRATSSAAAAKALAWGELTSFVRSDWDSVRIDAMKFALRCKFLQNPDLCAQLRASHPFPIAEDSEQDSFWGIGPGLGQNQLGRLIESVRTEISGSASAPVAVSPIAPFSRGSVSRLAAVKGEYRIEASIRPLPADYLGSSSLGKSIEEILVSRLGPKWMDYPDSARMYGLETAISSSQIEGKDDERRVSSRSISAVHNRSDVFNRALASAFDEKYSGYRWEGDARSAVSNWPDRFLDLLSRLVSAPEKGIVSALVIGAGAGEEASNVWARFRGHLTLVDIGPQMVHNGKRQIPSASTCCASAEDLHPVPSASFDLYCALRVYQSIYFDAAMAIKEAFRVLRPGGLFLVSISDAYLSRSGTLEKGQISGNSIDNTLTLAMACRIASLLNRMGFSDLGFADLTTELVVYGRKLVPARIGVS
jgi:N-glycosidase YbiA